MKKHKAIKVKIKSYTNESIQISLLWASKR